MADNDSKAVKTDESEEVEEVEEGSEEAGEDATPASGDALAKQLLQNPQVLAAIQSKLGNMGYIQSLPKVVKRRIKALKKIQFEATKIEADFYVQVHKLECEYAAKYAPVYERRKEIVTGTIEPTDSDCDWPSDDDDEDEAEKTEDGDESKLAEAVKNKAKIEDGEKKDGEKPAEDKAEENPSGVPHFWITILKNVDMLSDYIQEHDEPVLEHLQDIVVKFTETEPMGFTLDFHFEPNEYFTNTVLTKHYTMRSDPDETDPFSFEGPEIIKCKGCTIDWKKGKDITVKAIKKKQKHKGRGTTRTVTKTVKNESFFHFFSPPSVPEGDDVEIDEEIEAQLATDFEIGHFIRERLVPRAVLYFTGEALDDEEYEEEGMEDEDDDDDDENDPDFEPRGDIKTPGECKQQ